MMLDVTADGLSLRYGDFEALSDISFHLKGGKIYGLLGRNGAGKTSLLSLLASFCEHTAGSIRASCARSRSCSWKATPTNPKR